MYPALENEQANQTSGRFSFGVPREAAAEMRMPAVSTTALSPKVSSRL